MQKQRLREQGLLERTHAGIKKTIRMLIIPWVHQLHRMPHVRKAVVFLLSIMGLRDSFKRLIALKPSPKAIELSARALEIRQELKRVLERLESAP